MMTVNEALKLWDYRGRVLPCGVEIDWRKKNEVL